MRKFKKKREKKLANQVDDILSTYLQTESFLRVPDVQENTWEDKTTV